MRHPAPAVVIDAREATRTRQPGRALRDLVVTITRVATGRSQSVRVAAPDEQTARNVAMMHATILDDAPRSLDPEALAARHLAFDVRPDDGSPVGQSVVRDTPEKTFSAYRLTDARERVSFTNGRTLTPEETEALAGRIGGSVEARGPFPTRDEALDGQYRWEGRPTWGEMAAERDAREARLEAAERARGGAWAQSGDNAAPTPAPVRARPDPEPAEYADYSVVIATHLHYWTTKTGEPTMLEARRRAELLADMARNVHPGLRCDLVPGATEKLDLSSGPDAGTRERLELWVDRRMAEMLGATAPERAIETDGGVEQKGSGVTM